MTNPPPARTFPGDVLLFPWTVPFGEAPFVFRFGTFEVFERTSELPLSRRIPDHVLNFETREEAVLHCESRGISPTEIPFEPDFEEAVEWGNVRPWPPRPDRDPGLSRPSPRNPNDPRPGF